MFFVMSLYTSEVIGFFSPVFVLQSSQTGRRMAWTREDALRALKTEMQG